MIFQFVIVIVLATSVLTCTQHDDCITRPPQVETFPVSEDKISEFCREYHEYNKCVVSWADRCISGIERIQFDVLTDKSMKFLKTLCTNDTFKNDYLNEKETFEKIADQWKKCQNTYAMTVADTQKDPAVNKTINEICCAKDEFHSCIDSLCNNECSKDGKSLYNSVIQMMREASEVLNCENNPSYKSTCKSSASYATISITLLSLVMLLQIFSK
ncbi:uncharacterized protein LOC143919954 [Arctopsyche grandis]|uniref:uncharacterized protein LOC143919954 n=1 Tax=Arctopsyche grandis TaxID=121162 RepID=UPI00406D95CB